MKKNDREIDYDLMTSKIEEWNQNIRNNPVIMKILKCLADK